MGINIINKKYSNKLSVKEMLRVPVERKLFRFNVNTGAWQIWDWTINRDWIDYTGDLSDIPQKQKNAISNMFSQRRRYIEGMDRLAVGEYNKNSMTYGEYNSMPRGSLHDTGRLIKHGYDYNLNTPEERLELVRKLLDNHPLLDVYTLTKAYANKQIKTSSSFLSENIPHSKVLENIATYILTKSDKTKPNTDIIVSQIDFDPQDSDPELSVMDGIDVFLWRSKQKETKHKVVSKREVSKEEITNNKDLQQQQDVIDSIAKKLGYGSPREEREKKQSEIASIHRWRLKKLHNELKSEMTEMAIRLNGGRMNIHPMESETPTQIIYVNYRDVELIRGFLKTINGMPVYQQLKMAAEKNEDCRIIIADLDQLIDKCKWNNRQKDVLELRLAGYDSGYIYNTLKEKYGWNTDRRLRKILYDQIPNKIIKMAQKDKIQPLLSKWIKFWY